MKISPIKLSGGCHGKLEIYDLAVKLSGDNGWIEHGVKVSWRFRVKRHKTIYRIFNNFLWYKYHCCHCVETFGGENDWWMGNNLTFCSKKCIVDYYMAMFRNRIIELP